MACALSRAYSKLLELGEDLSQFHACFSLVIAGYAFKASSASLPLTMPGNDIDQRFSKRLTHP